MTAFVLKALGFGVLGLCAVILILVWRLLQAEQKRDGYPRKGILQACYVFMAFCFALAGLNGYVQLTEHKGPSGTEIESLKTNLRNSQDKLLAIKSAAAPILNARMNILDRMPPGPERDTLRDLLGSLRNIMD